MYSRAGQQGQGTDSCPEIKTTQKLYTKQKLRSRIISAITQWTEIYLVGGRKRLSRCNLYRYLFCTVPRSNLHFKI